MIEQGVILNVDDDESSRYARSRLLRHAGFNVVEAGTGTEAVRLAAREKPKLVICDIHLPDIDGFEVCRRIKAESMLTPVLHITATYRDSSVQVRGLESGADAYLSEPVEPEVFLATAKALLRMRRLTDELQREIAERKRAEAEKQRSELRFRTLLEANIIGVILADEEKILDANQAFLDLVGYTHPELEQGRLKWQELTPPEYLFLDQQALEQLRTQGTFPSYEKEYVRKDGLRVSVLIGAVVLERDPRMRWVCFVVDLSDRKALESRLEQARRLESVGRLAAGLAHDFNNILAGIMGFSSMALNELPDYHPVRPMIESVISSSERAAQLVKQLLAYAGKGRTVPRQIDLSRLVEEKMNALAETLPRVISVQLQLALNLPKIEADPAQVQQVINSLVMNGCEAIEEGRPGTLTISTGIQENPPAGDLPPGRYVFLEVRDTGCGMDEQTKARIFDPFFTTKFLGRGLSLAAVSGIMRSHRGGIQVESAAQQGSTFRLFFPTVVRVERSRTAPGARTVLVVDDEEVVRNLAKSVLERAGYTVLLAENGSEAVAQVERYDGDVDLVLLDLTMPVMSGADTLPALKQRRPNLRVVLSSGYDQADALRLFGHKGIESFLQKPYTSAQLLEKIESALAHEEGRRAGR